MDPGLKSREDLGVKSAADIGCKSREDPGLKTGADSGFKSGADPGFKSGADQKFLNCLCAPVFSKRYAFYELYYRYFCTSSITVYAKIIPQNISY